MIKVRDPIEKRVEQGQIFRNVHMVGDVVESGGVLEVERVLFPYVIVLTQDCDLKQDARVRRGGSAGGSRYKHLMSVLVAPLYNSEHVRTGEHLSELELASRHVGTKEWDLVKKNQSPRYHYLEFPVGVRVPPVVIDFKHYFSVRVEYLERMWEKQHVASVAELFRERISQRFASFLCRIALPDVGRGR